MTREVSDNINSIVSVVISSRDTQGIERAGIIASAIYNLKEQLNSDCMGELMQLQNNKLGFQTDSEQGYPEAIVKSCLIEALLIGVQPYGNQFNIPSGKCYITKEGFGHLLSSFPDLMHEIELVSIKVIGSSANVVFNIGWIKGENHNRKTLCVQVATDSRMKPDAIIGKAIRKARKWLFEKLTGIEVGDGEVADVQIQFASHKDEERVPTVEELTELKQQKLHLLKPKELADINRILSKNEVESFTKVHSILNSK